MPSYVIIELDRTPPKLNIYAPKYTTKDMTNRILIESDDELSTYHNVYVVDSYGNRHDYTFERQSSREYVGYLKFSDFDYGIVTLYIQVEDEVGNISNLESFSIEIKDSVSSLSLDINDYDNLIQIRDRDNKIEIYSRDSDNYTKDSSLYNTSVYITDANIRVSDEIIN